MEHYRCGELTKTNMSLLIALYLILDIRVFWSNKMSLYLDKSYETVVYISKYHR